MVSQTLPLASIASALLVGVKMVSQSIVSTIGVCWNSWALVNQTSLLQISRIPQNGVGLVVTQAVREINRKSVTEHLDNFGKNLGPGSAAVLERSLVIFRAVLHNFFVSFESGIDSEDLNTRTAENLRNDPLINSTAETTGEPSQGNSNSDLRELQPTGLTENLKQRAPFPRTSEDVVDGVLNANERPASEP